MDKKVWCMRTPVGHNLLDNMLPWLSERANLSKRYTNHSLRATTVTTMKKAKFIYNDICAVTGHKNPLSLRNYCSHPTGTACRLFTKVIDHTTAELAKTPAEKENRAEASTTRESPAGTATSSTTIHKSEAIFVSTGATVENLTIYYAPAAAKRRFQLSLSAVRKIAKKAKTANS